MPSVWYFKMHFSNGWIWKTASSTWMSRKKIVINQVLLVMTNKKEKLNSALKFHYYDGLSDLQYSLRDRWPWMLRILREMNFEDEIGNSMSLQRCIESLSPVKRPTCICVYWSNWTMWIGFWEVMADVACKQCLVSTDLILPRLLSPMPLSKGGLIS